MDLRERARLLGRAVLLGLALGAVGVPVAVLAGETLRSASATVFALGALVFGFALLGWSGSVFAGEAVENMQEYMDAGTNWTEADSRQAMAILGSVGFGGMVGSSLATAVVGTVV
ncbi:hypothetical protein NGM10_07180 [Halorussus salilacus]|uniref:DUF7268 family protein n=1 Tax=Halorussus salilacus TaxID=2953750 RepID=UPI00209E5EE7|nr:hypothetical protein [Halorussus salilacus]USZ69510.1 hypothetical protein NGM10_07180 [Halorussus salilacus]